jgi:hypothetical protein
MRGYTKPLEVRSGKLQINFIAIAAYMVDLKNGLAARHGDLIAYQWHGRWLRGSGRAAGLLRRLAMTQSAYSCESEGILRKHGQ